MASEVRFWQTGQVLQSGAQDRKIKVTLPSQSVSADDIISRLEAAGATLLALRNTGPSTRLRQMRFDVVQAAMDAYGWEAERPRAPAPDAAAISAMDEAFGWLALVPEAKCVLRRILGARALVHPLTKRHLFPWRRLAAVLGADHKSVQRWHRDGIGILLAHFAGVDTPRGSEHGQTKKLRWKNSD